MRVPRAAIRFTHTFGLGGMSLVLLGVLALTGSLLMLGYTPAPGDAYASIERLQGEVLFAGAGFHFWRVRKAGGVVVPPEADRDDKGKPEQVLFLPHLLWRETALFVFLAVAFAVLTATGIWFRGTGMRLVWPWNA